MITFVCCLIALIVGYFIYGKFIERIFGIDAKRQTPAYTHQDGVDYIPMPTWKVFMIQFLNIAGLGPIFGAIMERSSEPLLSCGSCWEVSLPVQYTITCPGCCPCVMNGESLPEIIGRYLGVNFKQFMRGFTVILMVLVGSVFVAGPAGLLAKLTPEHLDTTFWIIVVFLYYILATLLPVDKIIGKIYPLFAAALLFMAIGILVMLFVNHPPLPEITDGMPNTYPGHLPIFPIMFVSIACGAISGFHATQSPLMARCIKNEKYGRPIFFGSMITEGIVALIWAAAATYFYHNNGMGENNAAVVVDSITKEWLGTVGGILAVLGVIAAPITSGDTAFRSARLIVADFLHLEQRSVSKRLMICIPLFLVAIALLLYSQKDSRYSFPILAMLYPNLDYRNNNFHQDHLHPASAYNDLEEKDKEKYGWQVYNSILNLQMLDANENESKNAKPLDKWVSEQTRNKDMQKFMEDHLIPDTDLSLSNFSDFVEKRKTILVQRIKKMIN